MNDIGMRTTAGDYPPEHDAAEREERRMEAIEREAEDIADDVERGRTERADALLGFSWLWERRYDNVDRDDLVVALVDAIKDDTLGSSHAPAWVRRERLIRALVRDTLPRLFHESEAEHGARCAAALEGIGMILGEAK